MQLLEPGSGCSCWLLSPKGIPHGLCCVFLPASIQRVWQLYLNGRSMQGRKQISDIFTFSNRRPTRPHKTRAFPSRERRLGLGSLNTNKQQQQKYANWNLLIREIPSLYCWFSKYLTTMYKLLCQDLLSGVN